MIYVNLSYFDTILGPETLLTVPDTPNEEIRECTNSLLNISEFIDLKFFVYVSSAKLKTANIYTKIPSEWARGKLEMLLVSIILIEEDFSRLHLFEEVLEKIIAHLQKTRDAYKAFYSRQKSREDFDKIIAKQEELNEILLSYLPEIQNIVDEASKIPLDSEIIDIEANLQDEFVLLDANESILDAARKLASSRGVLLGVILEDKVPIGVIDEDDVINQVILKGKDLI